MPKKPSIADTHPELAKEWHPTLNGEITPDKVLKGSNKKFWWKCPKGEDHIWEAQPNSRANGRGCPFCSGYRVSETNSLNNINPSLSKEWHPKLNDNLTPKDVTAGTRKIVWWKCSKGDDHEWQASVKSRNKGNGCPICRGFKVVKSNSLLFKYPKLSKEWDLNKNSITPDMVSYGSSKKVWWKCPKGYDHEWQASISRRVRGDSCPYCSNRKLCSTNSLKYKHPELSRQWHHIKNNGLKPDKVIAGGHKKVWWKCTKGDDHEWKSSIISRINGKGCPICAGNKVVKSNSLGYLYPNLIKEIHPTKNKKINVFEIFPHSNKKIWWKCPKGDDHEWETQSNSRVNGSGCPICSGHKIVESNCLATVNPKLTKQWHPTKNGNLTPYTVGVNSKKRVWWKCPEGDDHEWEGVIQFRHADNLGCSVCRGNTVVESTCIQTTHPELASLFHPTKNGKLTTKKIHIGSYKKVWWKCPEGDDHEWYQSPNVLKENNSLASISKGCPVCRGLKVVNSNSLQTLNPKLSNEWHPTLNRKLKPTDFTINSNKQIWWQCEKNNTHIWKTSIGNRKNSGCPFCDLTPQSRQELIITFELSKLFKNINPKGYKTRLNGRLRAIDIFIPELNLAIEFDGSYWHKNKRAIDKIKSEMLMDEGYQVIRIREQPLKKIYENDIVSKFPYNGKEITDNILKRVLELYSVKNSMKIKIQNYISKDGLQNEKALNKYIDQILEEKAAKKK